MRNILRLFLVRSSLLLTLLLSACGGGGADIAAPPVQPPPTQQWPQSVAFTDFTGGQDYYGLYNSSHSKVVSCNTCINVLGIAVTGSELEQLLTHQTPSYWPVPYNNQAYSALPIDYNNKVAVVLEDLAYAPRYGYQVKKAEEYGNKVVLTVMKCSTFLLLDGVATPNGIELGILLPKTTKPIEVLTVQSGKPPPYPNNDLGAC